MIPSGLNHVILGPDAGIEDIPENRSILQDGETLEFLRTLSNQRHQYLAAEGVIRGILIYSAEHGVKIVVLSVLLHVVIGIEEIDEFAQIIAHRAKGFIPDVLFLIAEEFAQHVTGKRREHRQVIFLPIFRIRKISDEVLYSLGLARIFLANTLYNGLETVCNFLSGSLVIVLIIIEKLVIREHDIHGSGILHHFRFMKEALLGRMQPASEGFCYLVRFV